MMPVGVISAQVLLYSGNSDFNHALKMDDDNRLLELEKYNIVNTPPEKLYDDVTETLALTCKVPMSALSLLTGTGLFFKSKVGLEANFIEIPKDKRHLSMCVDCTKQCNLLIVEDLWETKYRDDPLHMVAPNIRFYAGYPLITPAGYKIGTLSILDVVPRKMTVEQMQLLRCLGGQVMAQLELRRYIDYSKKMQEELIAKNARLEALDKERVRFLGMISHDIRQSVSSVQVSSELLMQEHLTEENCELLESIANSADYMGNLLDELSDELHLRRKARNSSPKFKNADPVSLLKRNVLSNSRVAERKNISLYLTLDESITTDGTLKIYIDIAKIERVINNLISNAMKFSHPGTSIHIRAKKINSNLIIEIQDEGQGIPENELTKLFGEGTISVQPTGNERSTGLGLVIVKEIIEQHNGKIEVSSQVGIGTKFTVSLPIIKVLSKSDTQIKPSLFFPNSAVSKKLNVLIAEDNATNRKVLSTALSRIGYEVTAVTNGQQAVETARAGTFDLVLLDNEMPVMNGVTAAKHIKRLKPNVPIVSVSGSDLSEADNAADFAGFLTKPYNLQQLVQVVESAITAI